MTLTGWKPPLHRASVPGAAKGGEHSLDGVQPLPDLLLLATLSGEAHFLGGGSSVPRVRSHPGNLAGWGRLAKLHKRLPHADRPGAGGGPGLPAPQKEQEEPPLSFCGACTWQEAKATPRGPLPTPSWPTQSCLRVAGELRPGLVPHLPVAKEERKRLPRASKHGQPLKQDVP